MALLVSHKVNSLQKWSGQDCFGHYRIYGPAISDQSVGMYHNSVNLMQQVDRTYSSYLCIYIHVLYRHDCHLYNWPYWILAPLKGESFSRMGTL